jgi:hypothetical protein
MGLRFDVDVNASNVVAGSRLANASRKFFRESSSETSDAKSTIATNFSVESSMLASSDPCRPRRSVD